MTYLELLKKMKQQNIPSVCLLYGTESYFIQNIKEQLQQQVVEDRENMAVYDLEETPIQEVINDAETFPFFPGKKLIIANNAGFLKARSDKLAFEHRLETLEQYLAQPADYSVIVFVAPYEKLDERKKIMKAFKKMAAVVECNPIKVNELDEWTTDIANRLHIRLHEDAREFLASELSGNLHLLEKELEKLALYVGENGEVTREIAESLVSHSVNRSAFLLVNAVFERNLHKAITIYKDLEKMKEDAIALIALLSYQFRTILLIKLLKQKGYSQYQMQKQLGVHPYLVKQALNRERIFSVATLQQIIDQMATTDAQIKQGKMEKELAIELLLHDIIRIAK